MLAAAAWAWPPFALVAGLLLVGAVAEADGLFAAAGAWLGRSRLGPRALLVALLALDAVVTAVLNLDTAVVFLTPVLVHAARARGLDERPFLYGAVFMANAGSLLLPGSNLANLLVLEGSRTGAAAFGVRMLPAWLAACTLTAAFLSVAYRLGEGRPVACAGPPLRLGVGAAAVLASAVLALGLRDAALPELALGLAVTGLARLRPRVDLRTLAPLYALTVALGTLASVWDGPAQLVAHGRLETAAAGALGAVLVNNLPAAVLLSAHPPAHAAALLLGLDLGPNLAVTGSLSAVLWLRAARAAGARPSIATYSRLGALLVPLTLAAALATPSL